MENFFDEATKFASTFEEFFIEGIGIDILKKILQMPAHKKLWKIMRYNY